MEELLQDVRMNSQRQYLKAEFIEQNDLNQAFEHFVEQSIKALRMVDKMIEHDIEEHFST